MAKTQPTCPSPEFPSINAQPGPDRSIRGVAVAS
jgi:hypothetical protein